MSDPSDEFAAADAALDAGLEGGRDLEGGRAYAVLAYLANQIVEDQDSVSIEVSRARQAIKLSLRVADDDMGKVIGRRGRVAQSIRSVVRAAGAKDGVDVLVDIVD